MKRLLLILAMACSFASVSHAQVQLSPFTKSQFFDNNGLPLAGGCLFTYISGTATPLASYTDYTGAVPNSNPVILDAYGRADVWLLGQSYRLKMYTAGGSNCSGGTLLWTEDGINSSVTSLLALNNVWTGNNTWQAASTFNGSATFNSGFTSNGPSNLLQGGQLAGTFTGSPTFAGNINFSNGITTTTGNFSGQITSTVPIGTPPFVITSTTLVPNLNVAMLEGCTWEVPCPLGSTTPNTIAGTTINATLSLAINGSTPQTGVQGTDTNVLSAGTVASGTSLPLCTDANHGATTTGCPSGFTQSETAINSSVCTTSGASYANCTTTVTWPAPFVDTLYAVTCNGIGATEFPYISSLSKSTTAVTVTVSNGTSNGAMPSTYIEIDCQGLHP